MENNFAVTRAGRRYGDAVLSPNGLMTEISFEGAPPDSENIYRLAAVCGEKYVALGVPTPGGAGLTFRKSFSKNALRELGFSEPSAFELILPGEVFAATVFAPEPEPVPEPEIVPATTAEWAEIANPAALFVENGVAAITDEVAGALVREEGGFVYLAAPISAGEAFSMMPVFCFGTPETIGGRDYLIFKLKNGVLTA
ncbi:MAG: hypothetical protein LBN99_00345 [Oscillospiraceae bacterium]|jgi:hypothetical protein|nr:hypothetical protein [Oscillospiraceae bacterium]